MPITMSKDSIKETEDLSTVEEASKDESVVEATDVELKQYISGFKSEVDGHSHTIIEESAPASNMFLYSTHPPDPGPMYCLTDLIETKPGPRRKRRIKMVKGS